MAKADPAVLVKKSWAERVDAATKESAKESATQRGKLADDSSLFYDVRRVQTYGTPRRLSSYLYEYDAYFVTHNGNVDTSALIKVYQWDSNSSTRYPGGTRTWTVWRGRWEIIPPYSNVFGGRGIEIDYTSSGYTVNNVGVTELLVGTTRVPPTLDQYGQSSVEFTGNQFGTKTEGDSSKKKVVLRTIPSAYVRECTLPDVRNVYYKLELVVSKDSSGKVTDVSLSITSATQQTANLSSALVFAEGATTTGTFYRVYDENGNV